MARKTKEAVELTRQKIIDSAREVFAERGISRTTMEEIARAADVSRGAVYWHFSNKAELFYALRDQVILPLVAHRDQVFLDADQADPLLGIENFLVQVMDQIAHDTATNQTYEILNLKCEYVDDFTAVIGQMMQFINDFADKLAYAFERAAAKGQLRPGLQPEILAKTACSFIYGMIRLWLFDRESQMVRGEIKEMTHTFITMCRA